MYVYVGDCLVSMIQINSKFKNVDIKKNTQQQQKNINIIVGSGICNYIKYV